MGYRDLIFAFASLACVAASQAQNPRTAPPLAAVPAIKGVLDTFRAHPLVGMSDDHAFAQEEDFYVSLMSDPRFAREVRNVIVEFGNGSQQDTIDRYVNGDDVPYVELRRVWGDTSYVGWFPTVTALGYLNFFAAVRSANLQLPVSDRIHIWLGGKPIDWASIRTKEELGKVIGGQVDRYPADLVEQILNKHEKALLIYGTFHFYDKGELGDLIRQGHPGSLFVITPYTGFGDRACSIGFERQAVSWPLPALIPVPNNQPDQINSQPGCRIINASTFEGMAEEQKTVVRSDMEGQTALLEGNALLYLGVAGALTKSPLSPDLYLDPGFRKENARRSALFGSSPFASPSDPWPTVQDNPMSPRYLRDYGGIPGAPIR